MFRKLKNRIGEEIKQVQQFAQVISPTSSVNSLSESKVSSDSGPAVLPVASTASSMLFSISDDPENSSTFDLTANSPSIMPTRSRRDSLSSVASDASSLYPIYEGSFNHNQSEWESELDESTLGQLESINKAQLYQGYKKLLNKYQKYKTRYLDLSRSNLDLQRENAKTKNVLQESQDKSIRRIEELREQCQLEQKAKAHLEESLRNDLEERDHLITALKTKIGIIKPGEEEVLIELDSGDLQSRNNELVSEVSRLKQIIENVSPMGSAEHVKETITQLKSGIVRMKSENENISNLLSKSPTGDENGPLIDLNEADEKEKQIEKLNKLLLKCNERISALNVENSEKKTAVLELTEKLEVMTREVGDAGKAIESLKAEYEEMKKREEKLVDENRENQELIRKLGIDLDESRKVEIEIKSTAKTKLAFYESEIMKLKEAVTKATEIRDDALKKLKNEGAVRVKPPSNKIDSAVFEKEKERIDATMKTFFESHQTKLTHVLKQVEDKLTKAEGNIVRICADKLIQIRSTEIELQDTIRNLEEQNANAVTASTNLEQEIKNLKITLEERDQIIEENLKTVTALNLELNDKIDRIVELGEELETSTANHQLLMESTDAKTQNFAKTKAEFQERCSKLEEHVQQLKKQVQSTVEENLLLKTKNSELCENILKLEASLKVSEEEREILGKEKSDLESQTATLMAEIFEIQNRLHENSVVVKKSEERTQVAEKRLRELSANLEKTTCEKNELVAENQKLGKTLQEKTVLVQENEERVLDAEKRLLDLTENLEKTVSEKNELVAENQKLAKTLQNNSATAQGDEERVQVAEKRLLELTENLEKTVHEKNELVAENQKLGKILQKNSAVAQEDEQRAQNAEKRLLELTENFEKTVHEKNELLVETQNLGKTLQEKSENLQQVEAKVSENEAQITELLEKLQTSGDQCTQLRCEIATLQKQQNENEEKIQQLENQHADLLKSSQDTKNELQSTREQENRLKCVLEERETSFKNLSCDFENCKKELADLSSSFDSERSKIREESESKVNILKNEIKFLNEKFEQEVGNMESNSEREVSELKEKLVHSETMADELLKKLEDSSGLREELAQLCEERALKVGELESCLAELKSDLDRNFNQTSKISHAQFEETYETKLKQLVSDFEKQLSEKDVKNRELEIQLSENTDVLQSVPALRLELKNLRAELKEKDNVMEMKIEEFENLRKESENRILNAKIDSDDFLQAELKKYEQRLAEQKCEFDELLLQQKHSLQLENEEKVVRLENQLKNALAQRKSDDVDEAFAKTAVQDLESTSEVAVAAVTSSTESIELMRKELMNQGEAIKEMKKQHKREVTELRKLAMIRAQSMDRREGEDVEHEYLRNILYEYMMGREQLVLAKVLAAIVKFDRQQTSNILERQQSVNSLRIL